MIDIVAKNFFGISGAIASACFCAYLVWRHFLKKRKIDASDRFLVAVAAGLKEFYPPPRRWNMGFEPKLVSAITDIEPEVKVYRTFLSKNQVVKFDRAWKDLEEYSKSISWDECAAYRMYPNERNSPQSPESLFYQLLENLFTYRAL